jgi:hypothetical protein
VAATVNPLPELVLTRPAWSVTRTRARYPPGGRSSPPGRPVLRLQRVLPAVVNQVGVSLQDAPSHHLPRPSRSSTSTSATPEPRRPPCP